MLATLGHVGQDSGWYSHSLRAGWSGHRIPVGERFGAPIWSSRPYSYGYWGLPGFKVAWGSVNHPPPCNAEVEFCTYNLPVVPAWTVLEWTLPLPVTLQCCIQHCIKYCDVCPDSTGRLNFCYLLLTNLCSFLSGISSVSVKACTIHQEPKKPGKNRRSRSQRWVIFAYILYIILSVPPQEAACFSVVWTPVVRPHRRKEMK